MTWCLVKGRDNFYLFTFNFMYFFFSKSEFNGIFAEEFTYGPQYAGRNRKRPSVPNTSPSLYFAPPPFKNNSGNF
jgi:hypothetical protein